MLVAGIDEVGRGPIAGPVAAAAVLFEEGGDRIEGLRDSKLLSPTSREKLASEIISRARSWRVVMLGVEEIEAINILAASLRAMRLAYEGLDEEPGRVWIDGHKDPLANGRSMAVIGGDRSISAIQAAAILAKCHRDRHMIELGNKHPQYGFEQHKGYPTRRHLSAIRRYGLCGQHRLGFTPCRASTDYCRLSIPSR